MSEKILTQPEKIYTVEDYLNFKHRGSTKREFYNGKIFDTAGSSRRHNLIGSNTTIGVGSRLRGQKCEIYVNDMLVKLSNKSFCYPDVVIVKEEPVFDGSELDVLVNPTVIVEVSESDRLPRQNGKARQLSGDGKRQGMSAYQRRRNARRALRQTNDQSMGL